jgi:nickel transport protein
MPRVIVAALVTLILSATPAFAHKVILSLYPSGDVIEGELGFSNGDMAADQLVEVFDADGNKIGEATTDEDGYFTFAPVGPMDHIFRADLGAGHVADVTMAAEDLPASAASGNSASADAGGEEPAGAAVAAAVDEEALAAMIRDEIRPLRREIASYKEKNNLQTILGGIGYIVGLFGIGMYVAARRKLKDAAA